MKGICSSWSSEQLNQRPGFDEMKEKEVLEKERITGIENITIWTEKNNDANTTAGLKRGIKCWAAYDKDGNETLIESAIRGQEYICPTCEGKMIPKMGPIKAHHFAHKNDKHGHSTHCGGEGFRHFRVKTYLHKLLVSIPRYEFKDHITITPEKRVGVDQPDILIQFTDEISFAFEIIDTNPPSEEKRKRWKNRMIEINISQWRNEVLMDSAILSGRLVPYVIYFRNFMDMCKDKIINFEKPLKSIRETIQKEHADEIYDLETKHESNLKNASIIHENPILWDASWSELKSDDIIDNSTHGVSIKTECSIGPRNGDHVVIVSRKGVITYGILGNLIRKKYSSDFDRIYYFHLTYKRRDNLNNIKKLPRINVKT